MEPAEPSAAAPGPRGAVRDPRTGRWSLWVWSPGTETATVVTGSRSAGDQRRTPMQRRGECWWAELADAHDGMPYHLEVDGEAPVLDPYTSAVRRTDEGFRCVLRTRPWPSGTRLARPVGAAAPHPVVYEAHVRGFGRTFEGARQHLRYLADLGVDVIELMPVHPFDDSDNYWGYMPLVWGAVHEPYAGTGRDAIDELAAFVEAAHEHGIAVWLDVVFNHTGEDGAASHTSSWRALADERAYRFVAARYTNDSGCGNDINPAEPEIRRLVLESLERFAAIGVDGFRFDLASLLTRDGGGLVRQVGDWAAARDVALIAEAWDLAAYQVGDAFPDRRWAQWNDRFREDVRGFLRGEPGLVPAMMRRVAGSPDLFHGDDWRSVNFVTAHDGLTMYDLTTATSDRHRSWDCGPAMRLQYLQNAFALLLLSAGPAMFVMGDEFARTQGGDPNPYALDTPVSWVDWTRLVEWRELHDFVRSLLALRRRHPVVEPTFHGVAGPPDTSHHSRSLAWSTDGLIVMANMWWEPLTFTIERPGTWRVELATALPRRHGKAVTVAPRSVVVLSG